MSRFLLFAAYCCAAVFAVITGSTDDSAHDRVKRVSVDGIPSSDVDFDDGTLARGSAQSRARQPDRPRFARDDGNSYTFPIVIPPYNITPKSGSAVQPQDANKTSCLLYIESIAVLVFKKDAKDPSVGVAVVDGAGQKNTFTYSEGNAACLSADDIKPKAKGKSFSFDVAVQVKEPAKATKDKKSADQVLFSVPEGPLSFTLTFNRTSQYSWELVAVEAKAISVKSGTWVDKNLSVKEGTASSVASTRHMGIGGMGDYAYGCSSTKAASWKVDDMYTIGLSLGGVQVQAWGAVWKSKDGKIGVGFSRNVNDCVGTFSPGSWMGILVSIVLASVLIFGYLMLNSVQTMDRFDDPKQKQLIINAKE